MKVSAVIVTRGNVDLDPIFESLDGIPLIDEVVTYRNGDRVSVKRKDGSYYMDGGNPKRRIPDLTVYGRYEAMKWARNPVVYVQDDDCLIDAASVIAAYEPNRLVSNMPKSRWLDYPDSAMVGWGAVFDRVLPWNAFEHFLNWTIVNDELGPDIGGEDIFNRCSDVVFSSLTPRSVIDVGFEHLPWAEGPDRMFKQPGHKDERDLVLAFARRVRTWPDYDRRDW